MPTFSQILHQLYTEAPERVTVYLQFPHQPDVPVTYRQLLHGATGYAQALQRAGLQPGEVVIVILQHGEAMLQAFFGAVLGGAIPSIMPFLTEKLAPEKYRRDLASLIGVTRPAAIITYPEFAAEVREALRSAEPHSVRAVLISTDIRPVETLAFETLPGLDRSPNDIVLLQHSSGTTGLQKGVALSHQAVFNQLEHYARAIRLNAASDVVVSWLPLYHDMGLIAGFLMPILTRTPLVLMSPFDWVRAPARLLQAVSRYRGTLSWLPNFAYNFCAHAGRIRDRDLEAVDLSSWRAVINCSEPMHYHSHQIFAERFTRHGLRPEALGTCYAMAENVFAVTQGGISGAVMVDEVDERALSVEHRAVPATVGLKLLSCGPALPNVRVRVLDDQHRELPERHIGQIALQSDCLLTGYYHRPDLTEQAFHDGWYLTGDLGYLANGEIFITGRQKDLIIVGGKNVYPQDLERLAGDVPGIHTGRVVAFGIDDEEAGTEEVVVVAEAEIEPDETERQRLGDALRQRITRSTDITLRLAHIVGPKWLIKTSSGKIARAANREKYLAETRPASLS